MKDKNFRKSWIEEFETLKNRVLEEFSEEGFRNLKDCSAKLATYHYNKKKYMLLGTERKLYHFLIENSYNPYRIYRWFLLERIPEDVRFQLNNGMISQKIASRLNFKRKHESRHKVCLEIKLMGLNLVRSM